jgi:hypothetical protein
MKKLLLSLVTIMLIATGCGTSTGSNLQDVDVSNIKEEIKDEAFQSKLPTKIPFELDSATYSPVPEGQRDMMQTFQFTGVDGEFIDLKTYSGKVMEEGSQESEEVTIGDIKGKYIKNENGANGVIWKEDGLEYHLMAKEGDATKDELIEMAESFE